MDPETPQSPFPRPAPPEEPRLGIFHLLVWTACVAVYLGTSRGMWLGTSQDTWARQPVPLGYQVYWTLGSVAWGASWAGIVLWASRRLRGFAFPRHPGEYLLLALGGTSAVATASLIVPGILVAGGLENRELDDVCWKILPTSPNFVYIALMAWAAVRVKTLRWRLLFAASAVFAILHFPYFLLHVLRILPPQLLRMIQLGDRAVEVWLIVVVLIDVARGIRYPWTHWLGVAVRLWLALTVFAVWLLRMLTQT